MANINIDSGVDKSVKAAMVAPMTKGPTPRWERKLLDGQRAKPLSPCNSEMRKTTAKTPSKAMSQPTATNKTPKSKTPNEKVGTDSQGDRFIPNRLLMDIDKSHYLLMKGDAPDDDDDESNLCSEFKEKLKENLGTCNEKILHYKQSAPGKAEGSLNNMRVLFSQSSQLQVPKWKGSRHVPPAPEKILDAPGVLNDYYLNVLHWGENNVVAVGLSNAIYLWNANSGTVTQLVEFEEIDSVTCVNWVQDGNVLAVGLKDGSVELWDTDNCKRVRTMSGHHARIGSLSWNAHILSSGSRSGQVHQHDVRIPQHCVATLSCHEQEVCGLQWSPNGQHLASGGNDNILCVWDAKMCTSGEQTIPLFTLSEHTAAVKAVSWCPWQSNLLASGGGTSDRHIRFWSTATGKCIQSQDTNSQVCGILWNQEHKEIISGHGFSKNQLILWKYPSMSQVSELKGHTSRILCLTKSPDSTMVASVAADETLRIWKCFASESKKVKKKAKAETSSMGLVLGQGLR